MTTDEIMDVIQRFKLGNNRGPTLDEIAACFLAEGRTVDYGDLREELEKAIQGGFVKCSTNNQFFLTCADSAESVRRVPMRMK